MILFLVDVVCMFLKTRCLVKVEPVIVMPTCKVVWWKHSSQQIQLAFVGTASKKEQACLLLLLSQCHKQVSLRVSTGPDCHYYPPPVLIS